jgi:hypothetical protein
VVAVVVAEVDGLAAGEVDDLPAGRVELVDGDVDLEEQRHGLELDVATPRLVLLHVAQILQYTHITAPHRDTSAVRHHRPQAKPSHAKPRSMLANEPFQTERRLHV